MLYVGKRVYQDKQFAKSKNLLGHGEAMSN
jgi:hypothetical protein